MASRIAGGCYSPADARRTQEEASRDSVHQGSLRTGATLMARQKSALLPLGLGFLSVATLLIGGAALAARRNSNGSSSPPEPRDQTTNEPGTDPQNGEPPVPPQVGNYGEPGPLFLSYTTASILLEASTDKYNESDIVERVKAARARLASSEGNQLVKKVWQAEVQIINAVVPGAGTAIFTAFDLLNRAIGEIFPKSAGGFERLPPRTRKRLLFFLVGGKRALGTFTIDSVRPQAPTDNNREAWRRYYRQVLTLYRGTIEWERIINTEDDVVPPAVVCNFLIEQDLWPLPFEPAPPSSSSVIAEYAGIEAVRKIVSFLPLEKWLYPDSARLPEDAKGLAETVYSELWQEWAGSLEQTRKALGLCRVPAELAPLLARNGSIPRLGSYLLPIQNQPGKPAAGL